VAFEASGLELIKRLVAAGMGVTIIGESYAAEDAAAGRLKVLPLRGLREGREIGVAMRRDDEVLPAPARTLIAVAKESVANHRLRKKPAPKARAAKPRA